MQHIDPQTLYFLRHRRSHPPRMLRGPGPDRHELVNLLTLAARVPDHGKLEPWRFIVLERATLDRLAPCWRNTPPTGAAMRRRWKRPALPSTRP